MTSAAYQSTVTDSDSECVKLNLEAILTACQHSGQIATVSSMRTRSLWLENTKAADSLMTTMRWRRRPSLTTPGDAQRPHAASNTSSTVNLWPAQTQFSQWYHHIAIDAVVRSKERECRWISVIIITFSLVILCHGRSVVGDRSETSIAYFSICARQWYKTTSISTVFPTRMTLDDLCIH